MGTTWSTESSLTHRVSRAAEITHRSCDSELIGITPALLIKTSTLYPDEPAHRSLPLDLT